MSKSRYLYYSKYIVLDALILAQPVSSAMGLARLDKVICVSSSTKGFSTLLSKGALEIITGERAKTTKAKRSIAQFNLRQHSVVSCQVTLRKKSMYRFLDLCNTFVMPKQIFYNDTSYAHFDNSVMLSKNMHIGIANLLEFPLLEPFFSQFESIRGCNVNIIMKNRK